MDEYDFFSGNDLGYTPTDYNFDNQNYDFLGGNDLGYANSFSDTPLDWASILGTDTYTNDPLAANEIDWASILGTPSDTASVIGVDRVVTPADQALIDSLGGTQVDLRTPAEVALAQSNQDTPASMQAFMDSITGGKSAGDYNLSPSNTSNPFGQNAYNNTVGMSIAPTSPFGVINSADTPQSSQVDATGAITTLGDDGNRITISPQSYPTSPEYIPQGYQLSPNSNGGSDLINLDGQVVGKYDAAGNYSPPTSSPFASTPGSSVSNPLVAAAKVAAQAAAQKSGGSAGGGGSGSAQQKPQQQTKSPLAAATGSAAALASILAPFLLKQAKPPAPLSGSQAATPMNWAKMPSALQQVRGK